MFSQLARAIELEGSFQVWRSMRRKIARNWRHYPGEGEAARRSFLLTNMGRFR